MSEKQSNTKLNVHIDLFRPEYTYQFLLNQDLLSPAVFPIRHSFFFVPQALADILANFLSSRHFFRKRMKQSKLLNSCHCTLF